MKKIVLNVNEGNRIGQVPNKFFGHFLEYMHDCIQFTLLIMWMMKQVLNKEIYG